MELSEIIDMGQKIGKDYWEQQTMKKENKLTILCPYCSKPYTAKMLWELDSSYSCDTCGPGPIEGKIEIRCDNCKKIVYVKEVENGYEK